ncbi:MAG: hypothetical protein VX642_12800 [Bdellovibrionota bacterium]|nr:hypothetical protein [Bdellovibrionota bacterium]
MRSMLSLAALVFLTISCSKFHEGIYIYKDSAYTTQNVSDFEMQHFTNYSKSDKVLIVSTEQKTIENAEGESVDFKEAAEELCERKKLKCDYFDLKEWNAKSISEIQAKVFQFKNIKFMVIGGSPEAVALAVGTYSKMHHQPSDEDLKTILHDLGIQGEAQEKTMEKLQAL